MDEHLYFMTDGFRQDVEAAKRWGAAPYYFRYKGRSQFSSNFASSSLKSLAPGRVEDNRWKVAVCIIIHRDERCEKDDRDDRGMAHQ